MFDDCLGQAKRDMCPRDSRADRRSMTAAALLRMAGNPAVSSATEWLAEIGGFAPPPRGGLALELKLDCFGSCAQCLGEQTYEVGDSVHARRQGHCARRMRRQGSRAARLRRVGIAG